MLCHCILNYNKIIQLEILSCSFTLCHILILFLYIHVEHCNFIWYSSSIRLACSCVLNFRLCCKFSFSIRNSNNKINVLFLFIITEMYWNQDRMYSESYNAEAYQNASNISFYSNRDMRIQYVNSPRGKNWNKFTKSSIIHIGIPPPLPPSTNKLRNTDKWDNLRV